MSGELIDAIEADRIDLVSRIIPQDDLMDEARAVAHKLTKAAPLAQRAIKQAVYRAMFEPSRLADFMATTGSLLTETEDHIEGARAFAEKREPEYKGR